MASVLLVIHLIVAICLIATVLLQRSEGGALGMGGGGGGGGGGFLSGRGAANALTRTTAILTVAFFATSILLTLLARQDSAPSSVLDQAGQQSQGTSDAPSSSVLPQLPASPSAPTPEPTAPSTPSNN